ncbi:hypothetical protein BDK51DRAFT_48180 [Blyttiomyces helicus]|uniref:Uncharacterized protein n=1 Tax=Blyttiomyces helicus TaxID=388810 RepID=A0A4P9WHW0_9FUNG|nr:hypothetical protein BDK51DRAFT_48180 [Blyttiomyces helicus]|eukprot:RKO91555.1 hypothetical protein BDK51DRAFT_48180 [Blyttiomyces helicus]
MLLLFLLPLDSQRPIFLLSKPARAISTTSTSSPASTEVAASCVVIDERRPRAHWFSIRVADIPLPVQHPTAPIPASAPNKRLCFWPEAAPPCPAKASCTPRSVDICSGIDTTRIPIHTICDRSPQPAARRPPTAGAPSSSSLLNGCTSSRGLARLLPAEAVTVGRRRRVLTLEEMPGLETLEANFATARRSLLGRVRKPVVLAILLLLILPAEPITHITRTRLLPVATDADATPGDTKTFAINLEECIDDDILVQLPLQH